MAKRKKGKVVQMLSPENYIRQKARNLLIHECLINKDWKENGLAHIIVARKHTNGNLTAGVYLVDLKLLGVKDAMYLFNVSELEYHDFLKDQQEHLDLKPVPYVLVHNIIFAGMEFAEDYDFKPHKDFTSVAQYILEEDTEDIELIKIECGEDNMPLYVRGPLESETRAKQIIAQLKAVAGPGNYQVVWQSDDDLLDDDPWEDDFDIEEELDEMEERFEDYTIEEMADLIIERFHRIHELSEDEAAELVFLVNTVVSEYIDYELLDELTETLIDKLMEYEITEDCSDELLGITSNLKIDREQWSQQFIDLHDDLQSNTSSAGKKIKKLQKEMPDNPAVAFLKLIELQGKNHSRYEKELKHYHQLFPHYPLIHILWTANKWANNEMSDPTELLKKGPEEFFAGRNKLHALEIFHYSYMLITLAVVSANATLIETLELALFEIDIPEFNEILLDMIALGKIHVIFSLKEETS